MTGSDGWEQERKGIEGEGNGRKGQERKEQEGEKNYRRERRWQGRKKG